MASFMSDLAAHLLECSAHYHDRSLEPLYPYASSADVTEERGRSALKRWVLKAAARAGFHRQAAATAARQASALRRISRVEEGLEATYGLLADEHSRRTLVEVMAYRILGPSKVRMACNDGAFRSHLLRASTLAVREGTVAIDLLDGKLDLFDLAPLGFPIQADLHRLNVTATFQLEQYRYSRGGRTIEAGPGDVVIDGGGCWGDTALYFAHRVGAQGRVVSFEFSPDNLPILRANLAKNAALGGRVHVVERALWDRSDERLDFAPHGPATTLRAPSVSADSPNATTLTLTIDDLVEREPLPRVDFIKMDIEGAETSALRGAERTLKTFAPKLAVTLYHSLDDFVEVPRYLHSLNLGYQFFIDHFSIKQEETVLFAEVAPGTP